MDGFGLGWGFGVSYAYYDCLKWPDVVNCIMCLGASSCHSLSLVVIMIKMVWMNCNLSSINKIL